jgi:FtsH-binding integral membrane protein
VCFSYIVSFTTSLYAKNYGGPLVISAAIITIVVVAGLTVYAVFTKTDFTTHIGIIIVVIISFSVFGLLCIGNWNPVLYNLYCALGVIIGGILLILDTQSIVGG